MLWLGVSPLIHASGWVSLTQPWAATRVGRQAGRQEVLDLPTKLAPPSTDSKLISLTARPPTPFTSPPASTPPLAPPQHNVGNLPPFRRAVLPGGRPPAPPAPPLVNHAGPPQVRRPPARLVPRVDRRRRRNRCNNREEVHPRPRKETCNAPAALGPETVQEANPPAENPRRTPGPRRERLHDPDAGLPLSNPPRHAPRRQQTQVPPPPLPLSLTPPPPPKDPQTNTHQRLARRLAPDLRPLLPLRLPPHDRVLHLRDALRLHLRLPKRLVHRLRRHNPRRHLRLHRLSSILPQLCPSHGRNR